MKMTTAEYDVMRAIEELKEECAEVQKVCECKWNGIECPECHYYIAIEALEKQIPKKADTGESRIFGCKLCGYGMEDVYVNDEWNYSIVPMLCPHCGQAISWE